MENIAVCSMKLGTFLRLFDPIELPNFFSFFSQACSKNTFKNLHNGLNFLNKLTGDVASQIEKDTEKVRRV